MHIYFVSILMLVMVSCQKPRVEEARIDVTLNETTVQLHPRERWAVEVSTGETKVSPTDLRWHSSNENVAFITNRGEINAVNPGRATITVSYLSASDSLEVRVVALTDNNRLSLTALSQYFSPGLAYSTNVPLVAPFRVKQSFDLDQAGNIYYSQIGAASGFEQGRTKAHEVYIIKSRPNLPSGNDYMTLKYFGHGGNIAMDEDNGDSYVWVGSNATKYASGEYWDEQSVSRVPYEPGAVYEGYGGDTYFLNNGLLRIQAAVNRKSDLLCINATKDGVRYFYTYKLSEAEALAFTGFTFSVKIGGEETGSTEQVVSRTVQGRDLSQLTPLGAFHVPQGINRATDVNSFPFQGYDIDESSHIYFFEGNWTAGGGGSGLSQAYVTVFDINGNLAHERTRVSAISTIAPLVHAGITNHAGYMEAEGIKVKGNQLYLGFASYYGEENYRRANIFRYDCQRGSLE